MSEDPEKPLFVAVPQYPVADLSQQCETVPTVVHQETGQKLPYLCAPKYVFPRRFRPVGCCTPLTCMCRSVYLQCLGLREVKQV